MVCDQSLTISFIWIRIKKDLEYYAKEYDVQSSRISKMRAEQKDEADIRKQEEVLLETQTMLPDCQARLKEAFAALQKVYQSCKSDADEDNESMREILQEATDLLEAASACWSKCQWDHNQ